MSWVQTSQRQIDFTDLPAEWPIEEIAQSLSRQTRYNGHCAHHYSTAEHSVLSSLIQHSTPVPAWIRMGALLHDAEEAYTGDMPHPLKMILRVGQMPSLFEFIGDEIRNKIFACHGVPTGFDHTLIDRQMMVFEWPHMFKNAPPPTGCAYEETAMPIIPGYNAGPCFWDEELAELMFIQRYRELEFNMQEESVLS